MKTMVIRNAMEEDYESVFHLLVQLFPGLSLVREEQRYAFQNTLNAANEYGLCAVNGDEIVGYCVYTTMNSYLYCGFVFYITVLVVDKKYRRQGIGRALIESVKQIAVEKGIKAIELDSGFHRTEAHLFYENLGFEKECYFFSRGI